jgi:hypothetical protein
VGNKCPLSHDSVKKYQQSINTVGQLATEINEQIMHKNRGCVAAAAPEDNT